MTTNVACFHTNNQINVDTFCTVANLACTDAPLTI
jgi:hypothetical protein